MGFVGRKPTNAPLTSDDIPNGIIGAADLAAGLSKLTFVTTVKTSGFTAVANEGYFCNTTSATFTVTLPATPAAGDQVQLVDYAGTFDTNALTINPNSNKIEGGTGNVQLTGEREGTSLVYIDATQGWLATSGINEGTDALSLPPYSVDFLVIAGGGGGGSNRGGGGGAGGYRNSFGSETSGGNGTSETELTFNSGTVYTITVGAGGTGGVYTSTAPTSGGNSSISGTGITTITSTGGGVGGYYISSFTPPTSGGSGGGGGGISPGTPGASGTANQGFAGGNGSGSTPHQGGGGGGGASAVGVAGTGGGTATGGNGGAGLASSITGSSVTRGGGGGGGTRPGGATAGTGGTGGGGNGNAGSAPAASTGFAGSVNTGGGAGGGGDDGNGGAGGSGVVILSMPDASYSGTTTGSPTVATGVSGKTVLTFTGSGTYTG